MSVEAAVHLPVMLAETLTALAPHPGGHYLDGTVGLGGHAEAIAERSAPTGRLLGLDRDLQALSEASARLARFGERVELAHGSYVDAAGLVSERGLGPLDGILLDLGVSSLQLDRGERGFSFRLDGPLDMRFDPTAAVPTAADLVNGADEAELAGIIWRYGEEPASRRIARAIVRARPLATTVQLARLIEKVAGRPGMRTSPATRTFQALRIAVNGELDGLASVLEDAKSLLTVGGRLVVISFQSLEDRVVKQFIHRESRDCICPPALPECRCCHRRSFTAVTRGALKATDDEIRRNPRSRSARLRAAVHV
ncbi:MAG: 16S rRNA (cytosine(1402)-N(4))-methyltransferase RsmH [Dehalococcoidia bacterium]